MSRDKGKAVGNFAVEREIGRGGMGVVLLGRQRSLDRPAVLKKLRRDLGCNPEFIKRFEREARAAAAVHHENVVAVYDSFAWRGDHYIAQEYVDGVDLRAALRRARRIQPRIAALIALQVVRGLEAIHTGGTVHRDLKPANILLGRRGEVKIADFGIALAPTGDSLTQPGIMLGSPPYMPPEQMLGERVDARGDLYSLGVVCYEMLSGLSPFPEPEEGEGAETLLSRMQRERYVPLRKLAPGAPRYLRRMVRACLRGRPKQRIQSSAELRRVLERKLGRPSPADCKVEIATWLWQRGMFECEGGETTLAKAAPALDPLWGRALRWAGTGLAWGAACSLVLLVRGNPLPVDPELAYVRFEADAGVTVRVGDAPAVEAGRVHPLELAPGSYRLVFEHPDLGRAEHRLRIEAGDQRLVTPLFRSASRRRR